MTLVQIDARDLIVQVRAADGVTWLGIKGLTDMVPKPGEGEEKTDTTVAEDGGKKSNQVMQRGYSLELSGYKYLDHLTGAPDPGQARCEELAEQVGYLSWGAVRFRHPTQSTWKVWETATFSMGDGGGGVNAKSAWSCTIERSGASTTAAVA